MWEDLEEAWNYEAVARDQTNYGHDRDSRYESLYPFAYPIPYPVNHAPFVIPSPRRLGRRWESGWY